MQLAQKTCVARAAVAAKGLSVPLRAGAPQRVVRGMPSLAMPYEPAKTAFVLTGEGEGHLCPRGGAPSGRRLVLAKDAIRVWRAYLERSGRPLP
jgi:hypothetical protein